MLTLKQCWALFALKWTLVRRSWSKREFWGYVFLGVLLFLGVVLSLAISVGLYALASHVARRQSPVLLLLLLNGATVLYLFFYVWGVLMDLQRTDLIDFRKMLVLPVSLPVIYLLNFLVSVVSPIMLFALPGVTGMFAGLYPAYGISVFLVGIPLTLLFMLMMSAWAYYLRGRLAIIMENKRRRRMALVILPLCFVALGQTPALLSHMALSNSEHIFAPSIWSAAMPHLLLLNAVFPVFWPAAGLWAFMTGNAAVAILSAVAGLCLCILLGLRLGYVSTLRHYMGLYDAAKGVKREKGKNCRTDTFAATARSLPLLENDTAALTLAFYYSFARHPHIRMLLIMPLCLGLFFLFMYRAGAYGGHLAGETAWVPMAALAWPFFNFSLFLFNVFGVDAQSFQGLMLLPVQRRKYLIAKNIALAPFVLGLSLFFVATGALLVQAPLRVIALSFLLVAHLYLFFSVVGNYLSVRFPYRINRDALRQPTRRLRMLIVGLASTALVTLMILPATCCMLAERFFSVHPDIIVRNASLLAAAVLLVSSLAAYLVGLSVFGDQFTAKEHRIYLRISGDRE